MIDAYSNKQSSRTRPQYSIECSIEFDCRQRTHMYLANNSLCLSRSLTRHLMSGWMWADCLHIPGCWVESGTTYFYWFVPWCFCCWLVLSLSLFRCLLTRTPTLRSPRACCALTQMRSLWNGIEKFLEPMKQFDHHDRRRMVQSGQRQRATVSL